MGCVARENDRPSAPIRWTEERKDARMPAFVAREWNASGAIFCYSYGEMKLRAFVVEVHTTSDIDGALLQAAVDKALERMPYFRQTFVRKKGLYYYADNDLPFLVGETQEPREVGGAATNYHEVDVTYWGKVLRFAMNHAFCDGLGLNRLIESVLWHYYCARDGKEYPRDGIYTAALPYDHAETFDAYAEKTDADVEELKKLKGDDNRFRLPELDEPGNQGPTMYRKPVRVKADDLIAWGKACGSSPASSVGAFAATAIARACDVREGVILNVVPASLRRFLNAEKTFKNCSAAIFQPVSAADARGLPTTELAANLRAYMKEQMAKDETGKLLSSSINMLTHLGKRLPFFFIKRRVFAMPQSRPQDTIYLDYVGSLRTPGYEDNIAEVRYLNTDPCLGSCFLLMSEANGSFFLTFSQTFPSDRYREAFCKVLDEQGIAYEKLPEGSYLNPLVEMPPEQR